MPDDKSPLSKLWPNKGIDWTIMIVMAIALLCGAVFSGGLSALFAALTDQADLSPGFKLASGALGYGSALLLGIWAGRRLDARKRRSDKLASKE